MAQRYSIARPAINDGADSYCDARWPDPCHDHPLHRATVLTCIKRRLSEPPETRTSCTRTVRIVRSIRRPLDAANFSPKESPWPSPAA
jgi:hypothetical protein